MDYKNLLLTDDEIRKINPDECVCGIQSCRELDEAQVKKCVEIFEQEIILRVWQSRKIGIKEVVDYIENRAISKSFFPQNTFNQWKEQIKKWGIK